MACARPTDSDVEEETSSDRSVSEPSVSTPSPKTPRLRSQTLEENTSGEKQEDEGTFKRRSRTLTFRRKKTEKVKDPTKKGRSQSWALRLKKKLPARLKKGSTKDHGLPEPVRNVDAGVCVCTGYRRTEDHVLGPGVIFGRGHPSEWNMLTMGATAPGAQWPMHFFHQVPPPSQPNIPEGLDRSSFNAEEYPTEDIDEILIAQRASEIERGIEITSQLNRMSYPVIQPTSRARSRSPTHEAMARLSNALSTQCMISSTSYPLAQLENGEEPWLMDCRNLMSSAYIPRTVHTQVDYIHCMVPDLLRITGCGFYWGVMDRYEAERLLDNRPEGTFLLRDSAQEDYLFSVSFRRYGRSLHARIEQWNHKFSFDSHDPGVFSAATVCGLIEHYKDPSCCMFFEPMLTLPLHRNFAFSLQHLCRSAISDRVSYDGVSLLPLPKALRAYLQYYHYKQKVRVRKFDCQH